MPVETLQKYMGLMKAHVENKISAIHPKQFSLIYEGWTHSDTHYVGVVFAFLAKTLTGYKTVLLGFAPFDDERSLGCEQHMHLFKFFLSVFKKDIGNVAALFGDNVSVNKSVATNLGLRFVGCAIHRFNLAVKDVISKNGDLVPLIHSMMSKIRNIIPAAKLRESTPVKAIIKNVTRWSSTNAMVRRYKEIRDFIPKLGMEELSVLMQTNDQELHIVSS